MYVLWVLRTNNLCRNILCPCHHFLLVTSFIGGGGVIISVLGYTIQLYGELRYMPDLHRREWYRATAAGCVMAVGAWWKWVCDGSVCVMEVGVWWKWVCDGSGCVMEVGVWWQCPLSGTRQLVLCVSLVSVPAGGHILMHSDCRLCNIYCSPKCAIQPVCDNYTIGSGTQSLTTHLMTHCLYVRMHICMYVHYMRIHCPNTVMTCIDWHQRTIIGVL